MDPLTSGHRLALRLVLTLAAATLAAWGCLQLHLPLPWMLGPLLVTALLSMARVPVLASSRLRNLGQGLIGVALGLYFTPAAISLLWTLAPAVLVGVAWAFALGYGFYRFLWRINGGDRTTVFFSAAIGGASEMALLAERHGGQVDRAAAAHSTRLLLVVVLIPFSYQALGLHGADAAEPASRQVWWPGLLALLAAGSAGAWCMQRWRAPNPWVLGPLLVTALLAASGVGLSALPPWASNAGQLFIGVALGSRFTPDFARSAPRWLGSVALGSVVMIGLTGALTVLLGPWVGLHPATLLLATSPGGIAEMAITAKVLRLGVPVVTSFQVVRYVAVITLTAPLYRWEMSRIARQEAGG